MRFVALIGMLAALGGCSSYRDVSFYYYPDAPRRATFPPPYEFHALADKECMKYGTRASYNWTNYTPDFHKVRVNYICVQ